MRSPAMPITAAPRRTASWTASDPTPPDAPLTTMTSPSESSRVRRAPEAAWAATPSAALVEAEGVGFADGPVRRDDECLGQGSADHADAGSPPHGSEDRVPDREVCHALAHGLDETRVVTSHSLRQRRGVASRRSAEYLPVHRVEARRLDGQTDLAVPGSRRGDVGHLQDLRAAEAPVLNRSNHQIILHFAAGTGTAVPAMAQADPTEIPTRFACRFGSETMGRQRPGCRPPIAMRSSAGGGSARHRRHPLGALERIRTFDLPLRRRSLFP